MSALTIGVVGSPATGIGTVVKSLGAALDIRLRELSYSDTADVDGWLLLDASADIATTVAHATRPCLVVIREDQRLSGGSADCLVMQIGPTVDPLLRGKSIRSDDVSRVMALPRALHHLEAVATRDGLPVWSVDPAAPQHHFVAFGPPDIGEGERVFHHFSRRRLVCLLPLVTFMRSLRTAAGWQDPPLQASFMFDDPNLHSPTYGFLDYRELIRRAAARRYHATIATIPIDGWYVHRPTCALLAAGAAQVSFLCHGNDHVFHELGRPRPALGVATLFDQAEARLTSLERAAALPISRVMAPPHGACSEAALSHAATSTFEAVCVSRGSLEHHNPARAWLGDLGLRPCDRVARACVIPRFGLLPGCENDVLVAALLRQPIIPMSHHQAFADGYARIEELAAFINGLGDVRWQDMTSIARSMYSMRRRGSLLDVTMWSNRVSLVVPENVEAIALESPLPASPGVELLWRPDDGGPWRAFHPDAPLAAKAGTTIDVRVRFTAAAQPPRAVSTRPHLVPFTRRVLTELRDRVAPRLHALTARRAPAGERS